MIKGIDVSMFQGSIDWFKVKQAGIDFAYIRVLDTNGIDIDPMFETNWRGAKLNNVLRGGYVPHYAWLDPVDSAKRVFDAMDNAWRKFETKDGAGKGDYWMGELPIAIDVEPGQTYKSTEFMWNTMLTFISEIKKRCLVNPIIYTGVWSWDVFVNPNNIFKFDELPDLWHAGYVYNREHHTTLADWKDTYKPYRLSNSWLDYKIWQWAGDDGNIDGIGGACDLDVFNGSYAELVKWGQDHRIPEIDTVPDVEIDDPLSQALEAIRLFFVDTFTPKQKLITNQQVINAFFAVYGSEYWERMVAALDLHVVDDMVNNRESVFTYMDSLQPNIKEKLNV